MTAISGTFFLLFTILYPYVEHYIGTLNALRYSFFFFFPVILMPQVALLYYNALVWSGITMLFVCRAIFDSLASTAVLIVISNTVSSEFQGPVHGLAAALTNVSGAIAPFISGPVFAYSAHLRRLFHMNIPFCLIAGIVATGCVMAWLIDDKLDHPYVSNGTNKKEREEQVTVEMNELKQNQSQVVDSEHNIEEIDRRRAHKDELRSLMSQYHNDLDHSLANTATTNFEEF